MPIPSPQSAFDRIDQDHSREHSLLPLSPPSRTMKIPSGNYLVASNDSHLLVYIEPNLCLLDRQFSVLKETRRHCGEIYDMCWSSTLDRFIIITCQYVFTLDQETMILERRFIISDNFWFRGTCSDTQLFLSTLKNGSSISEYNLQPLLRFVKEWQTPVTCKQDQRIFDLKATKNSLAIIVASTEVCHLELRASATFDRLWSIQIGQGNRCCLINTDQWMVICPRYSQLVHISSDGRFLHSDQYSSQPLHAVQFGSDMVVIHTRRQINLHQLANIETCSV